MLTKEVGESGRAGTEVQPAAVRGPRTPEREGTAAGSPPAASAAPLPRRAEAAVQNGSRGGWGTWADGSFGLASGVPLGDPGVHTQG